MSSKYFKLILKSSKAVITELSEKQIDDLFDIEYLKKNAPERVYDGQFTDISGKAWNYSDIEKWLMCLILKIICMSCIVLLHQWVWHNTKLNRENFS
jgi:predicted DNA-binding protein